MDESRAILLMALEDLWRLVDILAGLESALDMKSLYYSLFAHCFQLHRSLMDFREPDQSSNLFKDLLSPLEDLICPDTGLPRCETKESVAVTYPDLSSFHDFMIPHGPNGQGDINLVRRRIYLATKDQLQALESFLMTANKALNDQRPIQTDLQISRKPRQRPPDHILPAADSLFKVLDSQRRCSCDPSHQYVVQLCLETHLARINDCKFDLYLGLERNWQEARIQSVTNRLSSGPPRIVIGNSNAVAPPLTGLGAARKRELKRKVERLCADIMKIRKNLPDYGLRFRMEENCLWKLQSERSSFNIDPSKAPETLAQFIAEKPNLLNEKTKRVLSVLLSYAMYHLIGTPWLKSWGSSNITFFRSSTGLPLRPYIETRLDENMIEESQGSFLDIDEEDFDPDDALKPPFPCLVDLAVVLLELHKATSFDSLAELYDVYTADGSDKIMARYLATREVFRHCASEMTDQTRMAVKACLNPNIGHGDDGNLLDEYALRGVIYQRIVHPLEDELEQGFSDLVVDRLDDLVRNLDLANGGQPLPLEGNMKRSEHPHSVPKSKRRGSDDAGGSRARVRFSHDLEKHVQQDVASLVASNNPCQLGLPATR